jgi:hypothetical protein
VQFLIVAVVNDDDYDDDDDDKYLFYNVGNIYLCCYLHPNLAINVTLGRKIKI